MQCNAMQCNAMQYKIIYYNVIDKYNQRLCFSAPREEAGRDWGDVIVPPCCIPFCASPKSFATWQLGAFHGRYFLYPQPASEYEQER